RDGGGLSRFIETHSWTEDNDGITRPDNTSSLEERTRHYDELGTGRRVEAQTHCSTVDSQRSSVRIRHRCALFFSFMTRPGVGLFFENLVDRLDEHCSHLMGRPTARRHSSWPI
ncbi:MAG: hypothetical protein J2P40_16745, partial [Candidatus Dormibacteraeota bacterium]|nr:hypothetical protein [Candidatus Dormibacteraeota bacterium]MBO0762924.1 hypothetical protein [Candidatus Dormibacteraeota bacterium]